MLETILTDLQKFSNLYIKIIYKQKILRSKYKHIV